MNPQPLRIRILRALELSPMTVRDLARCLCAPEASVRTWVRDMDRAGAVACCGRVKPMHARPWNVYRLAA